MQVLDACECSSVACVPWPVLLARVLVAPKSLPQINYSCYCLCGHGKLTMAAGLRVPVGPWCLHVRQKFQLGACGRGEHAVFHGGLAQGSLVATLAKRCCGAARWGPAGFGSYRSWWGSCNRPFGGGHDGSAQLGTSVSGLSRVAAEVLVGL